MSRALLSVPALVLAFACAAETSELPSDDDSPAASGSGGKKGSTSGGSLASSGKSDGGDEPDDTPGAGGEPVQDGGAPATGGTSPGGGKPSGGSAGKGGGGSGGSAVAGNGWKFPTSAESWAISYGEPGSLMSASSASWDSGVGNPETGSLKLSIPFSGTDQKLDVSLGVAGFDLTGKTITAKVKLDSGLSSSPDNPGGAKLYVKTGSAFIYADGGWANLEGDWVSLSLNVSSPAGYVAGTHTPADVREIGVEIATGSQGSYASATVHVDTVVY